MDAAGNSYSGETVFDPNNNVRITKLNSRGRPVWIKTFDFGLAEGLFDLDLDLLGNIYLVVQDVNTQVMFTAKIDPAGNIVWSRLFSE